jgi:hypothetical protein
LIGFELQVGPFAVAQLRLLAELTAIGVGTVPPDALRLYLTNTLGNPYLEEETLGSWYEPISESRRQANTIKRDEPILVVIGNPPYKEKSHGGGAWIESGSPGSNEDAALMDFIPPRDWGVGAHVKHLYNPYVYFWRWATWKVFDHHPMSDQGIVCFITVAGFLDGPGFEKMRDYLRRRADAIWIIDCSPEGHQPEVPPAYSNLCNNRSALCSPSATEASTLTRLHRCTSGSSLLACVRPSSLNSVTSVWPSPDGYSAQTTGGRPSSQRALPVG